MTTTIPAVPRLRGTIPDAAREQILQATATREAAERDYRTVIVVALNLGGSFREVSELTGLSTNTLQRWKREAI